MIDVQEYAIEFDALIGKMLGQVSAKIRTEAEEWVGNGSDITELVVLIFAKKGGQGMVVGAPRRGFESALTQIAIEENIPSPELAAQIRRAKHEVVTGARDMIPAVFLLVPLEAIHLVWLDPIDPSEVH